jgi:hypothetical protein
MSKRSLDDIQRTLARKSDKFWAKMRSTLNLLHRSKKVPDSVIDALYGELSTILDQGILNYPPLLRKLGLDPEMSYQEQKIALDLLAVALDRTKDQKRFIRSMEFRAENIRKANWSWRIAQEAEARHKAGWYPFFITLTIDPLRAHAEGKSSEQIWREGKEFRKYIDALCKIVTDTMGHPSCKKPPYNPQSNYIRYAGVIEHGKSRLHHHGHFIVWLRDIPAHWKQCPNSGIADPKRRIYNECVHLRRKWRWSRQDLSPAMYFRSVGDIWELKHNFSLPWDARKDKPMSVSTPGVAGHYITKYLQKGHKEWKHRMKATRNLGMKKLNEVMKTLDLETAMALTWRAPSFKLNLSLQKTLSVPLGLVRLHAKRQTYYLRFVSRQLDLRRLLSSNRELFTRMLKSVDSGVRPDRMDSAQFYDWLSVLLPAPPEYSEYKQFRAIQQLALHFPPDKSRHNHVKIGGKVNDGHSPSF